MDCMFFSMNEIFIFMVFSIIIHNIQLFMIVIDIINAFAIIFNTSITTSGSINYILYNLRADVFYC